MYIKLHDKMINVYNVYIITVFFTFAVIIVSRLWRVWLVRAARHIGYQLNWMLFAVQGPVVQTTLALTLTLVLTLQFSTAAIAWSRQSKQKWYCRLRHYFERLSPWNDDAWVCCCWFHLTAINDFTVSTNASVSANVVWTTGPWSRILFCLVGPGAVGTPSEHLRS